MTRRGDATRRLLIALAAGFAVHLAYPRPGWDLLGWVGLAPVLVLAATARSPRQAFLEGWVAGLGFFVPLLRWLIGSLVTFSTTSGPLAALLVVALSGYLALYWGAVSALIAWLGPRLSRTALWLAPAFWVTAELARTYVLSGFPWGLLGYIPYRRLEVIQVAAWTGVYGVSFLVVLVNAALAWVLLERTRWAAATAVAIVGLGVGVVLAAGAARLPAPDGETLPVAIVQGNIDQTIKWDKTFQQETLRVYGDLTRSAAPATRLVVWPEVAVPTYPRYDRKVSAWLGELAHSVGTPLLVGALDARREGGVARYFNSAFLVTERGLQASYDKMQLVPFGEYVPLRRLLFFVKPLAARPREYTPGRELVTFPLEGSRFATVICYEVIFPNLFRRFVAEGASFVVNITNDAWFGDSGGPLQHLAMVPLRAVENGVAVVRAANTGVSALVAPSGRVEAELGLLRRGFLQVEVPLRVDRTFYTRFGDLFAYACAAATAATLVMGLAGRRRGGSGGSSE